MVEGMSKINYKGKDIIYVKYDKEIGGNKAKTLALIDGVTDTYTKYPQNTALGLSNVEFLRFDMDILNRFKASEAQIKNYYKKLAIVGVNGLLKVAYNFVMALSAQGKKVKAFMTEDEAKEWLIS